MKNFKTLAVVLAALLVTSAGCGNGDNGGGGFSGSTVIDMAVGDKAMNIVDDRGRVLVWFDVLSDIGSGDSEPDVVIDTTEVDSPTRMLFSNGDLFVLNTGEFVGPTGNISIYRDYLTLVDDADADVFLGETGSGVADPKFMLVADGDLFVVDWGTDDYNTRTLDTAKIFRDVDTLESDDAPDVTLNNATSLISSPRSIAVADDDLYIGNWDQGAFNNCVVIFRDIATLTDNAAPDAVLTEDTSFSALVSSTYNSGGCRDVVIDSDILYVGYAYSDLVFVFNSASTLADDALPDVVLSGFGTNSTLNTITSMGVVNDILMVTNHNLTDSDGNCCTEPYTNAQPGFVAFADASALVDDQSPVVLLDSAQDLNYADRFAVAGNTLFITGGDDNELSVGDGSHSNVYIFINAMLANSIDDVTPILINGSDEGTDGFILDYPTGLAATTR